ncbi:MAG: NAD(P)-binding protein, partial [Nocardioides sp.]
MALHLPPPSYVGEQRPTERAALTRRGVLAAGAATGGLLLSAGAAEAARDRSASPAGRQGRLPRKVDVVVVGAGISGLVATRDLLARGLDVLCVEAR